MFTPCARRERERGEERGEIRRFNSDTREEEMTHTHRHDGERVDIVRTALSMISMFSHIHKCTARQMVNSM